MAEIMAHTRDAINAFNNLKLKNDKENVNGTKGSDLKKSLVTTAVKAETKPEVPAFNGLKPEEADEPLLVENKRRFVLFPIKYHEVSDTSDSTYRLIIFPNRVN